MKFIKKNKKKNQPNQIPKSQHRFQLDLTAAIENGSLNLNEEDSLCALAWVRTNMQVSKINGAVDLDDNRPFIEFAAADTLFKNLVEKQVHVSLHGVQLIEFDHQSKQIVERIALNDFVIDQNYDNLMLIIAENIFNSHELLDDNDTEISFIDRNDYVTDIMEAYASELNVMPSDLLILPTEDEFLQNQGHLSLRIASVSDDPTDSVNDNQFMTDSTNDMREAVTEVPVSSSNEVNNPVPTETPVTEVTNASVVATTSTEITKEASAPNAETATDHATNTATNEVSETRQSRNQTNIAAVSTDPGILMMNTLDENRDNYIHSADIIPELFEVDEALIAKKVPVSDPKYADYCENLKKKEANKTLKEFADQVNKQNQNLLIDDFKQLRADLAAVNDKFHEEHQFLPQIQEEVKALMTKRKEQERKDDLADLQAKKKEQRKKEEARHKAAIDQINATYDSAVRAVDEQLATDYTKLGEEEFQQRKAEATNKFNEDLTIELDGHKQDAVDNLMKHANKISSAAFDKLIDLRKKIIANLNDERSKAETVQVNAMTAKAGADQAEAIRNTNVGVTEKLNSLQHQLDDTERERDKANHELDDTRLKLSNIQNELNNANHTIQMLHEAPQKKVDPDEDFLKRLQMMQQYQNTFGNGNNQNSGKKTVLASVITGAAAILLCGGIGFSAVHSQHEQNQREQQQVQLLQHQLNQQKKQAQQKSHHKASKPKVDDKKFAALDADLAHGSVNVYLRDFDGSNLETSDRTLKVGQIFLNRGQIKSAQIVANSNPGHNQALLDAINQHQ